MDGEVKQIPLKPEGARFATKDRDVAEKIAEILWSKTITKSPDFDGKLTTLVKSYQAHITSYYLPPSNEAKNIEYAILPLIDYAPDMDAEDFTPVQLKKYRQHLIDTHDYTRTVVNRRIGMIRRMFKWAASELKISIHTYEAIRTVEGIRQGREKVRETKKILPAPTKNIEALLPFISETAKKILLVQRYSGMRSSEICTMTTAQIDRSKKIWAYRPHHKTEWRGIDKIVPLGPKAQAIIKPLLRPGKPNEPIFRTRYNKPFNKDSYRREIVRAFDKAKEAGKEIPYFHPHQIRHTTGTAVASKYGLDSARALLGHKELGMTQEYAELDYKKAEKVAKNIG